MQLIYYGDTLQHHGVKGMKWGVRRYQNADGSLTAAGKKHYDVGDAIKSKANALLNKQRQNVHEKRKKKILESIDPIRKEAEKQRKREEKNKNNPYHVKEPKYRKEERNRINRIKNSPSKTVLNTFYKKNKTKTINEVSKKVETGKEYWTRVIVGGVIGSTAAYALVNYLG